MMGRVVRWPLTPAKYQQSSPRQLKFVSSSWIPVSSRAGPFFLFCRRSWGGWVETISKRIVTPVGVWDKPKLWTGETGKGGGRFRPKRIRSTTWIGIAPP